MLFPWQQRIQSSSTVQRSSRTSPFWKLRCPSAVPVWSHSARTALQHKGHRRSITLGTPRTLRGSHRTGWNQGSPSEAGMCTRRNLTESPPGAGAEQRWHRGRGDIGGIPREDGEEGSSQTPFGMATCPPCPLGQSLDKATARLQQPWVQKTHKKMLKIVPKTPGKNSRCQVGRGSGSPKAHRGRGSSGVQPWLSL